MEDQSNVSVGGGSGLKKLNHVTLFTPTNNRKTSKGQVEFGIHRKVMADVPPFMIVFGVLFSIHPEGDHIARSPYRY